VKEHTLVSSRSSDIKSIFTPLSNESPSVSLHGGLEGFDEKVWEPIPFPPDLGQIVLFSEVEIDTIASEIPTACFFSSFSEDGEQGFPGRLLVEVLVGLMQPKAAVKAVKGEWNMGSVVLVYRAKLVGSKETVTPINLTQVS
jgi:aldose 1-epimerase